MESCITEVKNDKGEEVPKVCPKCGSKIGVFLRGEPVYLCTNKECNKFFGVVPFNESYVHEGLFNFNKSQTYKDMNAVLNTLSREEREYLENTLNSSEYVQYFNVIQEDNKTVAFISCVDSGLDNNSVSVSIAVNPRYRGKGYAKKLVNDLIAESKKYNIEELFWRVKPSNTPSIKLAESLKFTKVRENENVQFVYSYITNKNRKRILIPKVNDEYDLRDYVYKNIKTIEAKPSDKVKTPEQTLKSKKGSVLDKAKLVQECLLSMGLPSYTFVFALYTFENKKPVVIKAYPVCFTTYNNDTFILIDTCIENLYKYESIHSSGGPDEAINYFSNV